MTYAPLLVFGRKDRSGERVFDRDDAAYLSWLRTHPTGLVLNCERHPRAAYLVLHRAACRTINGSPARGRTWTADYIKVCADSRLELDDWASRQTGALPSPCGLCKP